MRKTNKITIYRYKKVINGHKEIRAVIKNLFTIHRPNASRYQNSYQF
jgi:hypothetical protein